VAVFGCGPVGQFTIASCKLLGAGRIFAIDCVESRLDLARAQGAEVINFEHEDPIEVIRELTLGIGVDRAIDAVGCDAIRPHHGPAVKKIAKLVKDFKEEVKEVAPKQHPEGDNWHPGDAPSLVLKWCVESLAKAGTLSIVGVYGDGNHVFPIGDAMNKNLSINMGNCNHRRYIPHLIELVLARAIDPAAILTQKKPLSDAIEAYREFDRRQPNWIKVELEPAA